MHEANDYSPYELKKNGQYHYFMNIQIMDNMGEESHTYNLHRWLEKKQMLVPYILFSAPRLVFGCSRRTPAKS